MSACGSRRIPKETRQWFPRKEIFGFLINTDAVLIFDMIMQKSYAQIRNFANFHELMPVEIGWHFIRCRALLDFDKSNISLRSKNSSACKIVLFCTMHCNQRNPGAREEAEILP